MLIDVNEFTTPAIAARMIGRSARRVQQLADAGVLRSVRAPHGRLVHLEAVRALAERYAATRRAPPAALPVEPEPPSQREPLNVSAPIAEPGGPVSDRDVLRLLDGLRRNDH